MTGKARQAAVAKVPQSEVVKALPEEGKTTNAIGNAALAIQIVNGLDMILTFLGVVPAGVVPSVVNGIVALGAGITQWWSKRKTVKVALFAPSPHL